MTRSCSIVGAAAILRVSRRTIYTYIRAGRLRTVRVGRSQRVLVASLQEECAQQDQRAALGVNLGGRPTAERA